ncbi:MAG TPA: hypothetical protein PLB52_03455 [Candidatus Moranbacteria bacterium]|nr:hypothetical protein [Candidatus Moranbacteria bacterium]
MAKSTNAKGKKIITPKELERMFKNIDLSTFSQKVEQKIIPGAEAYRIARAKSLAAAHSTVFI